MEHGLMARVEGLFLGKIEHRWEGRAQSAIGKVAASGAREIDENGFLGDA